MAKVFGLDYSIDGHQIKEEPRRGVLNSDTAIIASSPDLAKASGRGN